MNSELGTVSRLQTLTLHKNDVNGVALSNNFFLATASSDKTARICKWKTGAGYVNAFTLRDHSYSVTCVDWSPYGSLLATGSVDGTLLLWDVTTGEKLAGFVQPGNDSVRTCNFSNQSNLILSAGDSGAVNIWDINHLAPKKLIVTFQHGEEAVYGACFCPVDWSGYLVSGCGAGLLCLFDASGNNQKALVNYENAHEGGVTCVSFAPGLVSSDGGLVKECLMVSGGQDHTVKIWNVTLGLDCDIGLLRSLDDHSAPVFCVRIGVNGLIASASSDKTVRLWNLSGKCIRVLEGHDRYVTSCAFSKDGRLLASGSNDKTVIIWDLSGNVHVDHDLKGSESDFSLTTQEMWPQYEKLCKARMQTEKSVTLKTSFEIPKADFNSCLIIESITGPAMVIAAASSVKSIFAWNMETMSPKRNSPVTSHKYSINCLDYSANIDLLASASGDGTINLSSMQGGERVGSLYHPSGASLRVCRFSPDGSLLLAGSEDDKASLWDSKSNEMIKLLAEHEAAVCAAAFSPCSQYVITGCSNGSLKLWNCQPGDSTSICTQKPAHELGVTCCDFSPKGLGGTRGQHRLLVATGGNDSLVKLWQVTIGPQLAASFSLWQTYTDHGTTNTIMSVAFSPSGGLLASCGQNIRLWDMNGTCVQVIQGHARYVSCVRFSADGSLLVSCSGDHSVKVWELKNDLVSNTGVTENHAIENMISKWSTEDVVSWLAEIGLGGLGGVFESRQISGEKLYRMNDALLSSELEIDEENVRKQILTELQWLKSLGMSSKKCISSSNTISVPQEFFCPITHDIFAEPVICADSITYELAAIKAWFLTGRTTSPITNEELSSLALTPNFELQNRISEFLAQRLNSAQ